jgi:LacI family transcriptional regulator
MFGIARSAPLAPSKSRTTIQAIADHLGMSKFAVSRALSGKPGVSDSTRQLIVETAGTLGYHPRRHAGREESIEVIFRSLTVASRELWVDVQHGIEAEAVRFGYGMAVRLTESPELLRRLEQSAAGFVLVGPHDDAMRAAALALSVPAVVVNHLIPPLMPLDQISATDVEAGAYVAGYLAALGHRRVVYAHGQLGYPGRLARLRGFADGVSQVEGMAVREIALKHDQAADDLRRAILKMVEDGFEPTAIFCGSDGVAVTVASELMRFGLKVPEDVSVIGHADYGIATQFSPQLTTVHMPHREMGVAAVRMLLARKGRLDHLDGLPPQRISLVPTLVARQSSGPAPRASWARRLQDASLPSKEQGRHPS